MGEVDERILAIDPGERILAIDPGERFCGMALGSGPECHVAWTVGPVECQNIVAHHLANKSIDTLVVEEFRLYPDKAMELVGSQLLTVEVIGVLRYLHRLHTSQGGVVRWVQQSASIKKPIRAILRAKQIKSKAKELKASNHAADAELHLWYYVLKGEVG